MWIWFSAYCVIRHGFMRHTMLNQSFQKLGIEWISLYLLPVTQLVGLYGPVFLLLLEDNLCFDKMMVKECQVWSRKKITRTGIFFLSPSISFNANGEGLCQLWEATSSKICLAIDRTFFVTFFHFFVCLEK